ncbi:MAG: hypothetical protein CM15mP79_0400 [Methanobacteriota archaeon]|nr:MAG: hypothetical protein CM15mP79_0400 [Euryarchaeota archaeon]
MPDKDARIYPTAGLPFVSRKIDRSHGSWLKFFQSRGVCITRGPKGHGSFQRDASDSTVGSCSGVQPEADGGHDDVRTQSHSRAGEREASLTGSDDG